MAARRIHLLFTAVVLAAGLHANAQDSRTAKAVLDSSSLVHYLDPFTSYPGGIKQSLRGLGWLDPTPRFLRTTSIIPSTRPVLTYGSWPLTNGLMAKPLVGEGIPGFYAAPVEPVMIERADVENTDQREPNSYYYFYRNKIEIKPPSFNNGQLVAPNFERPHFEDPQVERPDFDLRGVARATLKRYPNRRYETIPGGLKYQQKNRSQPSGELAAPKRRHRPASYWDVNDARNDPRAGNDPELVMEDRRKIYWRANYNFRNPSENIDAKDPKPSYAIRPTYQPEFRRRRPIGGF
ncbi:MAG: hypothetical protein ACPGVU_05830 [Limisphaerales bacterium]